MTKISSEKEFLMKIYSYFNLRGSRIIFPIDLDFYKFS